MSKEAMKLALEALEFVNKSDDDCDFMNSECGAKVEDAITALEEALANHIPDDTKMVSGVKDSLTTQQEQGDLESGFFSREAMAAHSDGHVHLKQEQCEPFGYWFSDDLAVVAYAGSGFFKGSKPPNDAVNIIPLYTTPQQRKPLSEAAIEGLAKFVAVDDFNYDFARAIEKAHGIKENT